jgi:hypothetical protein
MFLGDFNAKVGEKIFSNQQWGMRVYVKWVMLMGLQ